jgi:hypothetical protein
VVISAGLTRGEGIFGDGEDVDVELRVDVEGVCFVGGENIWMHIFGVWKALFDGYGMG